MARTTKLQGPVLRCVFCKSESTCGCIDCLAPLCDEHSVLSNEGRIMCTTCKNCEEDVSFIRSGLEPEMGDEPLSKEDRAFQLSYNYHGYRDRLKRS